MVVRVGILEERQDAGIRVYSTVTTCQGQKVRPPDRRNKTLQSLLIEQHVLDIKARKQLP